MSHHAPASAARHIIQWAALCWGLAGLPAGDLTAMVAISLLSMSVEGWYGALMLLSGGAAYAMVKTAPAMAQVIREVGFAFVDVRIKYRRELSSIRDEIGKIRAEALEKAEEVDKKSSEKRHALIRDFQGAIARTHGSLLEENDRLRAEVSALKAKVGHTDVRDARAINDVSTSVAVVASRVDPELPKKIPLPHIEPTPDPDAEA